MDDGAATRLLKPGLYTFNATRRQWPSTTANPKLNKTVIINILNHYTDCSYCIG